MEQDKVSKIMFVINSLYTGGAERQVVDDFNEMYKRGLSPILVTLRKEKVSTLQNELLDKSNWKQIEFKNLFHFRSWKELIKFIKTEKPDFLISSLWFANTISRIASRLSSVKKVIIFEQNIYDSIKTKKMFFIDWILQFLTYKIIAVSEVVKKSTISHGILGEKISVLHNSVNLKRFENVTEESITKFKLDNNLENDFVVTTIGRLNPQKNIGLLIRSVAKVPDVKLLIVGDGELREGLEKLSRNLNISDRVLFLGSRNDIPVILASSDCFVLTSNFEGLGIVILEAMASSLPIITTSFDVIFELIEDNKSGLIVDYDEKEVSQAIKKLIEDTELRKNLGQEALKLSKKFSIEEHADKMFCILKS